jgi:predicted dehydrogenase
VWPVVSVISGRNAPAVAAARTAYGVPEHTTDWRSIIGRGDIDVVDICTPPGTHAEIATPQPRRARPSSARNR